MRRFCGRIDSETMKPESEEFDIKADAADQPALDATLFPNDVLAFDGTCGFCSSSARRWRQMLGKVAVEIAPVQLAPVRQALGLAKGEAAGEMVLICRDGRRLGGVDAYIEVVGRFRLLRPIAAILRWPVFDELLRWGYRLLAANRHWISRVLRLKPEYVQSGGNTDNDAAAEEKAAIPGWAKSEKPLKGSHG
jgi:predicted DCC family thiol-disulfide oxidoreductase YuxK